MQIDADRFASRRRPERGQRYRGHDNSPAKRRASRAIYETSPANDDELGPIEAFRLHPRAALAGQIGPVEPLGDDPFEPVLTRRLTEDLAADHGLAGRIRHFTLLECAGALRQTK